MPYYPRKNFVTISSYNLDKNVFLAFNKGDGGMGCPARQACFARCANLHDDE